MFAFLHAAGGVDLAFTDRHGGVSEGPWESLNLGTSNGDESDRVRRNLDLVADAFQSDPRSMVRMSQFHGREVHVVGGPDAAPGSGSDVHSLGGQPPGAVSVPAADVLVTAAAGVTLLVRVADCVPVVVVDEIAGVVGVVHAGRKGMAADVVGSAVQKMREMGARQLTAWVGPRACGRCYEVPARMRADVAALVPESWSTTSWGTPSLDIGAGVMAQLDARGVVAHDLAETMNACTIENDDFYSYRRQGQRSGRSAGLVRWRP